MCSLPPSSTRSRWASTRRHKWCATRASMASKCARSMSIARNGIARWKRPAPLSRGASRLLHGAQPEADRGRTVGGSPTYDRIAASRAEKTFTSIEDVWRRAGVPMATLLSHRRGRRVSRSRTLAARSGMGDQGLCAMKPCRSLPPPMTVRACYGRKHWSRASRLRR